MSKIPIIFSTVTGNAFRLADAVSEVVPDFIGPYNIRYFEPYDIKFIKDDILEKHDTFILSYWCDKGSADGDTIALIKKMKGKKLILIGSAGVERDSDHARKVDERVRALADEENILVGHFLCQGAIDLNRTAERLKLPAGERGHMTPERYERQKLTLGHPDETDLADAKAAVREFLKKL